LTELLETSKRTISKREVAAKDWMKAKLERTQIEIKNRVGKNA